MPYAGSATDRHPSTSPKQVHLNILEDMLLDPFQLNEFDTDVHLFDIDPDLQYFNIGSYNDKIIAKISLLFRRFIQ